jgi:hypothetical protein
MPISLTCSCGKSLRIKEELAGRKVRCPGCRDILTVPEFEAEPEPEPELLEAVAADPEEGEDDHRVTARPESRSSRPVRRREPELDSPPPRKRRDPDLETPPPRKRRPRRKSWRDEPGRGERGGFGGINAGIGGGILMILIAVVWFVAGLAGGIIFFYPPILLVIGIGALIKGMTDNR